MLRNRASTTAAKPELFRPVVAYWATDPAGRPIRIPKTDPRWNMDCPPVDDDIFDASQIAVDPEHCRLGLGPGLVQRYSAALAAMGVIYRDVVAVRGAEAAPAEILELQLRALRACEGARLNVGDGEALSEAEFLGRGEMHKAANYSRKLADLIAGNARMMNLPLHLAMDRAQIRVRADKTSRSDEPRHASPSKHEFEGHLATWLRGLADVLTTLNHDWLPPWPIENLIGVTQRDDRLRVTGLAFEIVTYIKNATSPEKWPLSIGFPLRKSGKPHWPIVAEFVNAALGEAMTGDACRNRVMSFLYRNRPLPSQPEIEGVVKTSVRLWPRDPRGYDRIYENPAK